MGLPNHDEKDYMLLDCTKLPMGNTGIQEDLDVLIKDPEGSLYNMNRALNNVCLDEDDVPRMKVIPVNFPHRKHLKEISGRDIGHLISIDVVVRKVKQKHPRLKVVSYQCQKCGTTVNIIQDLIDIEEPMKCGNENCDRDARQTAFFIDKNKSTFIDVEDVYAEEPRDNLTNPEPYKAHVLMTDDLCQELSPGQRVIINGILKPRHKKDNKFETYIECISFENLDERFDIIEISKDDKDEIQELAKHPYVFDIFTSMVAPEIVGLEVVKQALVLQLFGGVEKEYGRYKTRGDSHILLIGDPGTAKSKLLKHIQSIAPKSVYVSGRGTSTGGLIGIAKRDEEDGEWTIEAGAIPLADRGILLCDEIEKMSDADRKSIHEPMEVQTCTITKAALNVVLQARTTILAAANPKRGRFNLRETVSDQIDLDPAHLSRFDLMFPIMDRANPEKDGNIAGKILSTHKTLAAAIGGDAEAIEELKERIDIELFKKYIAYAKQEINPVLTQEAMDELKDVYVTTRKAAKEEDEDNLGRVSITPRQLEALVRLTEASARSRLSNEATIEDAERAVSIYQYSMDKVCRGEDGQMDIDRIEAGVDRGRESKIDKIVRVIKDLCKDDNEGLAYRRDIIKLCTTNTFSEMEIGRYLDKLHDKGTITEPKSGRYKLI